MKTSFDLRSRQLPQVLFLVGEKVDGFVTGGDPMVRLVITCRRVADLMCQDVAEQ